MAFGETAGRLADQQGLDNGNQDPPPGAGVQAGLSRCRAGQPWSMREEKVEGAGQLPPGDSG